MEQSSTINQSERDDLTTSDLASGAGKPKRKYVRVKPLKTPEERKVPKIPYHKSFYYKHRDRILEEKKTKFNCSCGGVYTLSGKTMHSRRNIHKNYLLNLNPPTQN